MRNIKLKSENIKRNGKTFSFYLSGKYFEFSNYTQAKAFVAKTNDFYTARVAEANILLGIIEAIYRRYWLYFDNGTTLQYEHAGAARRCKNALNIIENQMELAVERSSSVNGPQIVQQKLHTLPDYFRGAIKALQFIARKRSDTSALYDFDNLFEQVSNFEKKLNDYGISECTAFKKKPSRHVKSKEEKSPLKKVS